MPQQWSPTETLQLCNDGRCVGHAPSKGRKCQMRIGYDNSMCVNSLVAQISSQEPDAELLRPKLRRMAARGLCVRYHQYQVDDMVDKWMMRIRIAFPPRATRHIDQSTELPVASSRVSSVVATTQSFSTITSVSDHSEIQILQETIAAMQETIRVAQLQIERLQCLSPSTSSVSRVSTDEISTLHLSRTPSIQSVATTRSGSMRPTAPSPPIQNAQTNPPATSSVVASTHAPLARRCARIHVRRLPLEEECAICYDDTLLSECNRSDLVWCKSGCGRSVHKECFEIWEASCVQSERAATCTYCRTRWENGCAC